jgi:hypothetical protein
VGCPCWRLEWVRAFAGRRSRDRCSQARIWGAWRRRRQSADRGSRGLRLRSCFHASAGSGPRTGSGSLYWRPARRGTRYATSDDFKRNVSAQQSLVDTLRGRIESVRRGGPGRARERHVARSKLLPRDRVDALLDVGSPFLELSPLAVYGMYDEVAPSAGIITGVGRVAGRECVVVANDATVKGGTYYPMTVKKHLRAREVAPQNSLPRIYLVDSGGVPVALPRPTGV